MHGSADRVHRVHQGLCLEQVLEGELGTIGCCYKTRKHEHSYLNQFFHVFIIVDLSTEQVLEGYASTSSGIASGRTRRARKAGTEVTVYFRESLFTAEVISNRSPILSLTLFSSPWATLTPNLI